MLYNLATGISAGITVKDDGVTVLENAKELNISGSAISATQSGPKEITLTVGTNPPPPTFSIASFSNNVNQREKGQTVTSVTLSWSSNSGDPDNIHTISDGMGVPVSIPFPTRNYNITQELSLMDLVLRHYDITQELSLMDLGIMH